MKIKILSILLFLAFVPLLSLSSAPEQSGNEMKGKVELIIGKAYVKDQKKWKALNISDLLSKSDTVKVAQGGSMKIRLSNGNILEVQGGKTVLMENLMAAGSGRKGSMTSLIKKISKSGSGDTGITAVVGVRGADVAKQKKKVKTEDLNWKKQ
ncbi:MAG: hypothetical protein PHF84_04985 [bacterium]|nr:hypothetical protein [bacterium]